MATGSQQAANMMPASAAAAAAALSSLPSYVQSFTKPTQDQLVQMAAIVGSYVHELPQSSMRTLYYALQNVFGALNGTSQGASSMHGSYDPLLANMLPPAPMAKAEPATNSTSGSGNTPLSTFGFNGVNMESGKRKRTPLQVMIKWRKSNQTDANMDDLMLYPKSTWHYCRSLTEVLVNHREYRKQYMQAFIEQLHREKIVTDHGRASPAMAVQIVGTDTVQDFIHNTFEQIFLHDSDFCKQLQRIGLSDSDLAVIRTHARKHGPEIWAQTHLRKMFSSKINEITASIEDTSDLKPKKRRGRPPGRKNKSKDDLSSVASGGEGTDMDDGDQYVDDEGSDQQQYTPPSGHSQHAPSIQGGSSMMGFQQVPPLTGPASYGGVQSSH